jgi:hypothetical protein
LHETISPTGLRGPQNCWTLKQNNIYASVICLFMLTISLKYRFYYVFHLVFETTLVFLYDLLILFVCIAINGYILPHYIKTDNTNYILCNHKHTNIQKK